MRTLAWSIVTAALGLVLVVPGCVSTNIGNFTGTCSAGDHCECDMIGNCTYRCPGGNCSYTCSGIGNCFFYCDGGNCDLTCLGEGNCTLGCSGGGCSITCSNTGNCICSSGCE